MNKAKPVVVGLPINGVKVFSGSTFRARAALGDKATEWMLNNPMIQKFKIILCQSSDREFHCITLTILYWDPRNEAAPPKAPPVDELPRGGYQ